MINLDKVPGEGIGAANAIPDLEVVQCWPLHYLDPPWLLLQRLKHNRVLGFEVGKVMLANFQQERNVITSYMGQWAGLSRLLWRI